jgi:hypothetical protein
MNNEKKCTLCVAATMDASPQVFQLDFSKLPLGGITAFVGGTESGKSTAMVEMLYQQRNEFDLVIVMCDSMDDCMEYAKIVPEAFVFEGYRPDVINAVYNEQQKNTLQGHKTRVAFVLDDLGYDKSLRTCKTLARVANNGRHARIRTYLAIQDVKQMPPAVRKAMKHIVLAKEKRLEFQRRIYDSFNPCFDSFEEFQRVFQAVAPVEANRCMVMYMFQGCASRRAEDNVWWMEGRIPWRKFQVPNPAKRRGKAVWDFNRSFMVAQKPGPAGSAPQEPLLRTGQSGDGAAAHMTGGVRIVDAVRTGVATPVEATTTGRKRTHTKNKKPRTHK